MIEKLKFDSSAFLSKEEDKDMLRIIKDTLEQIEFEEKESEEEGGCNDEFVIISKDTIKDVKMILKSLLERSE
jgi:hypothetical protein